MSKPTLAKDKYNIDAFLSFIDIKVGNGSVLTIVKFSVLLKENVALFLKLPQDRRRVGVILLGWREVIVGIRGSITFGDEFMRIELSADEGFVEVGVSLKF
jgi:hypothetical protein